MPRMSRSLRLPRWTIAIAALLWIVFESIAIYFFILDRRLTRELVRHTWSAPTTILSAAHGTPQRVWILYGVDWRITPPVRLASLPRFIPDAFVAAEDVRFHHHIGIDPIGMARALWLDLRAHGIAPGGSTIDQQIVKARFLSNERTWRRKLVEIPLAVMLDFRMRKNEILEIYLNDVYLGHNAGKPVLGIDEAARLYFDKRPQDLRLDEAALLAGIIRAPNRDTPDKCPDIARVRRNAILAVMHDRHWIGDAQYNDAITRVVEFRGGDIPQPPFPFYLRALRSELVDTVGIERVIEGGLTIACEIDPRAQAAAERAASSAPGQLEARPRTGWETAPRAQPAAERAASSARGQLEARFSGIRAEARSEPLQVAILSVDQIGRASCRER